MTDGKMLSDFQKDALTEVGNIGIGHATTSLSQMVNKRVWISIPDMKLLPLTVVPNSPTSEQKSKSIHSAISILNQKI
jgi:chemotaxis protein CheC